MRFHLSDVLGQQVQEERIDWWLELDSLLHFQHQFSFRVSMVVDGSQGCPQNAAPLRTHNKNITVDEGLTHCESRHRNNHILLLPQHQKPLNRILQERLEFAVFG